MSTGLNGQHSQTREHLRWRIPLQGGGLYRDPASEAAGRCPLGHTAGEPHDVPRASLPEAPQRSLREAVKPQPSDLFNPMEASSGSLLECRYQR